MSEETKLDMILSRMDKHDKETKEWREGIDKRLMKTEEELFFYKVWIRVLKGIGMFLLLVITLKFGDISKFLKGTL